MGYREWTGRVWSDTAFVQEWEFSIPDRSEGCRPLSALLNRNRYIPVVYFVIEDRYNPIYCFYSLRVLF